MTPPKVSDANDELTGLVFNIQRFSVHDGPGIRTTVFMKGCPLTCLWCGNPESQKSTPQLMTRDIKCTGCGACTQVCPHEAIRMAPDGRREICWGNCEQCLKCVDACIYGALDRSGELMTVDTVLEEVLRDRLFYKNSGGGVTVSGGEPLMQSDFVAGLLKACKAEGLHTAADTTGCIPWQKIEAVVPWTDLLLWDIKHLDSHTHRQAAGVDNRLILKNLEQASGMTKIWIRIPLIQGFNDNKNHMQKVLALAKRIKADKISLLPYHEGGRSKSRQIGQPYACPEFQIPADEQITYLQNMILDAGILAGIGN